MCAHKFVYGMCLGERAHSANLLMCLPMSNYPNRTTAHTSKNFFFFLIWASTLLSHQRRCTHNTPGQPLSKKNVHSAKTTVRTPTNVPKSILSRKALKMLLITFKVAKRRTSQTICHYYGSFEKHMYCQT